MRPKPMLWNNSSSLWDSYKSIAWRQKLDIAQVKCILKHFDLSLKQQLDLKRLEVIKHRRILGNDQISWLKDYLSSRRNKRVIAEQVITELRSNYPEIGSKSVSTVRRILKNRALILLQKAEPTYCCFKQTIKYPKILNSLEILKALVMIHSTCFCS